MMVMTHTTVMVPVSIVDCTCWYLGFCGIFFSSG